MSAAQRPVGGRTHPVTPATPVAAVSDALRRPQQPPPLAGATHPDDIDRVRDAASLARTVLPGPIGDHLHRDLIAWCEFGHRLDPLWGLAIAGDLEKRAHALIAERTYG